eukprot:148272-Hanusia_phi.AAC.1
MYARLSGRALAALPLRVANVLAQGSGDALHDDVAAPGGLRGEEGGEAKQQERETEWPHLSRQARRGPSAGALAPKNRGGV